MNYFFIEYRSADLSVIPEENESEVECRPKTESDSDAKKVTPEGRKEKRQRVVRQIPFLLAGMFWTSLIVVALVIPLWYNYQTKIDKTSYMVFQTSAIQKDGNSLKETRIIQVRLKLIVTRLPLNF